MECWSLRLRKILFSSRKNRVLGHKHRVILQGNGTNCRPNRKKKLRDFIAQEQTFQIMNMLFLVYGALILLILFFFFFSLMQKKTRTLSNNQNDFVSRIDCEKNFSPFSLCFLFCISLFWGSSVTLNSVLVSVFMGFSIGVFSLSFSLLCLFIVKSACAPFLSLQPNVCFTFVLLLFLLFLFVLPHILLAFYLYLLCVCVLVALQTQMQNRRVLAAQFPKSQPCWWQL